MKRSILILSLIPQLAFGLLSSPKALGRANTAIAQPQDCFSAACNPAGLAFLGNRYDVGVLATYDTGTTKINGNDIQNGNFNSHRTKDFYLPEAGITMDVCECYMTLGIIAYNQSFMKTEYDKTISFLGTSRPGFEYIQENLSPVFTIRFGGCHAIGFSADFLFQRLKVNGLQNLEDTLYTIKPDRFTNKGYDYSYGVTGTIGWTSIFSNWVFIGLAYQAETKMSRFAKYKGLLPNKGECNLPQRFKGGIAIRPVQCATFEFDVEHITWSQSYTFKNHLEPNFNNIPAFGTKLGVGLGWRDQTQYRWGMEYRVNDCLLIKTGYIHARTPIRSKETLQGIFNPYIVDQYATGGFTWFVNHCTEVSGFYGYGFTNQVKGKCSIPFELGGGNADLNQRSQIAGISIGRKF